MFSGQCCQCIHCRRRPDWRPWRPLAALPAWRPCVAALAGLLPAFSAALPASGGLAAGRDCLACGLGGLTVPWRPLAASALAALASFLAGWRRLAASAGGLGGLGGLLAALTTLLWRALQPIYFSFAAGGIYFSNPYFIFLFSRSGRAHTELRISIYFLFSRYVFIFLFILFHSFLGVQNELK